MFTRFLNFCKRWIDEIDREQEAKRKNPLCPFCKKRPREPKLGWCSECDGLGAEATPSPRPMGLPR